MNKKPIWIFTGLAVAALAAVAGLTQDRWLADAPRQIAVVGASQVPQSAEASQPVEQPEAAAEKSALPEDTQPAAEATAPAGQPAAETPEPEIAATPDAPAGEPAAEPAQQQEQQTAAVQPEQPASEAGEAPAAVETPAAQADPAASTVEIVPAFDTVRVEKTGEAVVAGTAEAGSEVILKLDGQQIGKTTANADGAFVVVPDQPLPPGSGALTIEATGKGDATPTQSDQSVAVIIPAEAKQDALVAVVSPNAPTKVLQKPAAQPSGETEVAAVQPEAQAEPETQGEAEAVAPVTPQPGGIAKIATIDAVDYDADGNIVFSGQGQAGHTVRIYVDNSHAGDATIGDDGRWTHAGKPGLETGVHALRVDGLDPAGKVLSRVEVPFFREAQTTVAATTPDAGQSADQTVVKSEPETPDASGEAPAGGETEQTAAATTTGQVSDQSREGRVVIQPGNNLWRISRVLYGTGEKYTLLYQANKDQIRNPNLIYPGQIFKTPEISASVELIDPERRDPLTPEENAARAE